LFCSKVLAN